MIYGAAGYTARLIVQALADLGTTVVLGGRNAAALATAGLPGPTRIFEVEDAASNLDGITVVLNATGNFNATSMPLARACIARGVHYLDLAGEASEHLALLAIAGLARASGSMILPGAGFGVVPSELAAVEAARRLGSRPESLLIAYEIVGGASRGTLETVLRNIHRSGVQRRDGELVTTRPGARRARMAFGSGDEALVVTNPWRADLVSAFISVGSPAIETLATYPAAARFLMKWPRLAESWLGRKAVGRTIDRAPDGPTADERAAGRTRMRVEARAGERNVSVVLRGPEAYDFTARAAAAVATRVLGGATVPGFATPSAVLSWPQLLALDGVAEVAA